MELDQKKFIVLSSNDNPKYLYCTPLTIWAWRKIGYEPIFLYHRRERTELNKQMEELTSNILTCEFRPVILQDIPEYKSETITQVSRLFASCLIDPIGKYRHLHVKYDDYLLTGDIDMLPLSDIWSTRFGELPTIWGRDLTDYHYPICYIGMSAEYWHKIMRLESYNITTEMQRVLNSRADAKSKNSAQCWVTDQNIITERVNEWNKKESHWKNSSPFKHIRKDGLLSLIDRGTDKRTGYPIGRVDRSHWTLDHKQLIDAHLPHDILTNDASFRKVMDLLHHVWPSTDFKWFIQYTKEFKKLL